MKNLKVWKKLALIGLVFLIPLVATVCFFVWQIKTLSVDITRDELAGLAVADPLLDLTRDLQLYRAWAAGGPAFAKERDDARQRILDKTLPILDTQAAVGGRTSAFLDAPAGTAPSSDNAVLQPTWKDVSAACRTLLDQPIESPV